MSKGVKVEGRFLNKNISEEQREHGTPSSYLQFESPPESWVLRRTLQINPKLFQNIPGIQQPQQISLATAITLFKTAIAPIATYGINIIWDKLTITNLSTIEKVKARYLKRILGIGKSAPSRLTYVLAKETFFIEDIRAQFWLPNTKAYEKTLHLLNEKKNAIWPDFYTTDAITTADWKQPNYELRHIVTRYATHGFHHKLCRNQRFHQPEEECVCKVCNEHCERYHAQNCKERTISIIRLGQE